MRIRPRKARGGVTFRRIHLPANLPPIAWGVKDDYLLVGMGAGGSEELAARLAPMPNRPVG